MTTLGRGRWMKRILVGVGALALAGTTLGCSSGASEPADTGSGDEAASLIPVRLEYNVGTSTLPIVVAEREGFFADHGVEFLGKEIAPGPAGMAALGQQSDVLQTTFQTVLEAADKGLELDVFAGMGLSTTEQPSFPVFVNDDSVETFADLGGKTIGVPSLTGFATTALEYVIEQEGGDAPEFVVVPWDTQADQLGSQRVSAVWSINPHATNLSMQGYEALGDPTLIATGQDELVASILVTTDAFAEKHPEALTGIVAALEDAKQWIADNDDEAKQILIDWIGLDEKFVIGHPMTQFKITITEDDLTPPFEIYNELGLFTQLNIADLYYDAS